MIDTKRIAQVIEPPIEAMGYRLVRVIITGGRRPTLQIIAERRDERPMTVDDCANISQRQRDVRAETIGEWCDRTASPLRYTPAGRRIAICSATYSDATCKTCGACTRVRDAVIGFPAHGAMAKSRNRNGRSGCAGWRKLGVSRTQDDGRGHRRRSSIAYNPCQQQLAGVLAF